MSENGGPQPEIRKPSVPSHGHPVMVDMVPSRLARGKRTVLPSVDTLSRPTLSLSSD